MIYTVTLNPSLDYIVTMDHFTVGDTNRAKTENIYAGGKGINVSIVLKKLGIPNTALGFAAGFTGIELKRQLDLAGINSNFINLSEGTTRINFKFQSDETTEVNGVGPVVHSRDIDHLYKILDLLEEDDILVLAGSIPARAPETIYEDIAGKAVLKGVKFIVDSYGNLLYNTLKYKPLLVKPNRKELGDLFGVKITNIDEAIFYGKKLQEAGARNVLVSLASMGAILITEEGEIFHQSVPEGILVNSVGAGDSTVAGFLKGYLETDGKDLAYALKMGVACGSACSYTDNLADKQQIMKLFETM